MRDLSVGGFVGGVTGQATQSVWDETLIVLTPPTPPVVDAVEAGYHVKYGAGFKVMYRAERHIAYRANSAIELAASRVYSFSAGDLRKV